MIWSRKNLWFATVMLVASTLLAASGKVPWVIPAFIGVAFLLNLVPWIRGGLTDPLGSHEAGHVVAVILFINRKAWYMGNSEPLTTTVVLRTSSGAEVEVEAWPSLLPKPVKKQVFSSSWVILASSWSTNLRIKDPKQRADAIEQARHGGYRFDLPEPAPVQFRRSQKGRLAISGV